MSLSLSGEWVEVPGQCGDGAVGVAAQEDTQRGGGEGGGQVGGDAEGVGDRPVDGGQRGRHLGGDLLVDRCAFDRREQQQPEVGRRDEPQRARGVRRTGKSVDQRPYVIGEMTPQRDQIQTALAAERLVQAVAVHAEVGDEIVDGHTVIRTPTEKPHGGTHGLILVKRSRPAHATTVAS
jgi:hypothetical protein